MQSAAKLRRFAPSSSLVSVSGPDTQSPFMRLRHPRLPRPCCTEITWVGNHWSGNVQ